MMRITTMAKVIAVMPIASREYSAGASSGKSWPLVLRPVASWHCRGGTDGAMASARAAASFRDVARRGSAWAWGPSAYGW